MKTENAAGGLAELARAFDSTHERLFTFALEAEREIVNLRAVAQGQPAHVDTPALEDGGPDPCAAVIEPTRIWIARRQVVPLAG